MTNPKPIGAGIALNQKNAKKFVQRLKKSLEKKEIRFKLNECYEILAETFGASNWHKLSLVLESPVVEPAHISVPPQTFPIFHLPFTDFCRVVTRILDDMCASVFEKEVILYILKANQNPDNPKVDLDWESLLVTSQSGFLSCKTEEYIAAFLKSPYSSKIAPVVELHSIHPFHKNFMNRQPLPATQEYVSCLCSPRYEKKTALVNELTEKMQEFQKVGLYYDKDRVLYCLNMLEYLKNNNPVLVSPDTYFLANNMIEIKDGMPQSENKLMNLICQLNQHYSDRDESLHEWLLHLFENNTSSQDISNRKLLVSYLFCKSEEVQYIFEQIKKMARNHVVWSESTQQLKVNLSFFNEKNQWYLRDLLKAYTAKSWIINLDNQYNLINLDMFYQQMFRIKYTIEEIKINFSGIDKENKEKILALLDKNITQSQKERINNSENIQNFHLSTVKLDNPQLLKAASYLHELEYWTHSSPEALEALQKLGEYMLHKKTAIVSNYHDELLRVLDYYPAYISYVFCQFLDSNYPGVSFHYVMEEKHKATDSLFLDRLRVLANMDILDNLFAPMRVRLIVPLLNPLPGGNINYPSFHPDLPALTEAELLQRVNSLLQVLMNSD